MSIEGAATMARAEAAIGIVDAGAATMAVDNVTMDDDAGVGAAVNDVDGAVITMDVDGAGAGAVVMAIDLGVGLVVVAGGIFLPSSCNGQACSMSGVGGN
jgi:hypothetical protein